MIKQAVILAGGLGTRLKPFTDDNPKPMYPINGKPFIGYLIEQIKSFGIENILILLGYMPEKIMKYLGNGEGFGVTISYDITPVEFQTGDRILHIRDKLEHVFLLMYCDNYCPINYMRLKQEFIRNDAWIQVSAYANKDQYTKSNLNIDQDSRIRCYDKKRTTSDLQGVDIGYAIVRADLLDRISIETQNFESVAYPYAVQNKKMFATVTEHRYYSVGSWERIELTKKFFGGRRTVFLDRDGTINKRAPKACYIEKPEQFVWLEGAREAIRLLNVYGYRVLMVTNQPGIARGNLTEEILHSIHKKMQADLEMVNAHIDRIYHCPHNWNEGCECRKPKPGMLYQAQKDYSLNLTECTLIGDDDRDIEAGTAAGCRTYQVTEDRNLLAIVEEMVKEL